MKTDYLDIVLIHSDGEDLKILEQTDCLPTLLNMQKKGQIRAIGMSTKTVEGGLRAVETLDLVMATYNPSYTDDAPVIAAAHAANKGVLIKKALNSGHDALGTANRDSAEPTHGACHSGREFGHCWNDQSRTPARQREGCAVAASLVPFDKNPA
jgi:aryl-alcohol dehydrogenase-like predicted oxidoreductase